MTVHNTLLKEACSQVMATCTLRWGFLLHKKKKEVEMAHWYWHIYNMLISTQLILYLNSNANTLEKFTPAENTVKHFLYISSVYPANKKTAFAKEF